MWGEQPKYGEQWGKDAAKVFSNAGRAPVSLPTPDGKSAGCGAKLSLEIVLAAQSAHARDPKTYSVAKLANYYGVTRNTMHRAMQLGRNYGVRDTKAEKEWRADRKAREAESNAEQRNFLESMREEFCAENSEQIETGFAVAG